MARPHFKYVDFIICSYRGNRDHIHSAGYANEYSGDTIIVNALSGNPERTTAHEISHLFGATDGNCSSNIDPCVMRSVRDFDQWCNHHRNQILAGRNR